MTEPLKKTTGKAFFWSFIDKGGQQFIQLVVACILARLLERDEAGAVALLAIFTAVANLLQESGFSAAIIRKKTVLDVEYSSVFYFNIAIGLFIYAILFAAAPLIASYYETPELTGLARIVFLSFLFNAFGIIQNINLVRKMDFKTNTRVTFIAGCASGVVAVTMAFKGFGAWSLAAQQATQALVRSLLLWICVKWKPKAGFSFLHIKRMSSYSIKILLASVLNQICGNIYTLIIGKSSLAQAGLYSYAAVKLNSIPQSIISEGIRNVAFPLLSELEGDDEKQRKAFRKVIRITAFISFPVALMLIVVAKPLIVVLLSSKWIDAEPILQILAVSGSLYPIYGLISTLLQQKGKSGSFFFIELGRNILALLMILVSIHYGVLGLVTGIVIVQAVAFVGGYYVAGRFISYSLKDLFADISPYIVIAIVAAVPVYFIGKVIAIEPIHIWRSFYITTYHVLLVVQTLTGGVIYLSIVKMMGSQVLDDCINFVRRKG